MWLFLRDEVADDMTPILSGLPHGRYGWKQADDWSVVRNVILVKVDASWRQCRCYCVSQSA